MSLQKVDNIYWWRKLLKFMKLNQGYVDPLLLDTTIIPIINVDRPILEFSVGMTVNDTTSATSFGVNRKGQRFVCTGVSVSGKSLTTDGLISVYGNTDETTSIFLTGGTYVFSLAGSSVNVHIQFQNPVVFRENASVFVDVVSCGSGSVHYIGIQGYWI